MVSPDEWLYTAITPDLFAPYPVLTPTRYAGQIYLEQES